MNEPNKEHDPSIDEELVAYLDGELDADAASRFESRLAEDGELRQKFQEHRRTWDLLDELPRTDVGDQFAQTTVEMVAVSVADQVENSRHQDLLRARMGWLIGGVATVAATLAGYALVAGIVAAPNRQLVEDLRVIENLDEYRAVEDVEFLRALEREGLFATEVVDEL